MRKRSIVLLPAAALALAVLALAVLALAVLRPWEDEATYRSRPVRLGMSQWQTLSVLGYVPEARQRKMKNPRTCIGYCDDSVLDIDYTPDTRRVIRVRITPATTQHNRLNLLFERAFPYLRNPLPAGW
jgi:hypothetical protein